MSSISLEVRLKQAINSRIEALMPEITKPQNLLEKPISHRSVTITELDQFSVLMNNGQFSVYYVKRAEMFMVSGGLAIYAVASDFESLVIKSIAEFNYIRERMNYDLSAA